MTSLKTVNRRVGSLFAVAALVLATITPGLVPAFASAAQVTERSIELSSSSKQATGVKYTLDFTAVSAAGAYVLEFCTNSPLISGTCTAPAGFNMSAATPTGGAFTFSATTAAANNRLVATGTVSGPVSVEYNGITNPTAAGTVYARIVTYDTEANAQAYTSTALGSGVVDQGSAAISITDTVAVSGAVAEAMTFCVSGQAIANGSCGGTLTAPTLKLGEGTGDALALSSSTVSTGSIYSQISTNAASGAVVNLKSSATNCGGLVRAGAPTSCDIAPAGTGDVTANSAKFGVKVVAAADPTIAASPFGTFRAASDTPFYSDSVFKLNYQAGNASGVTSPYGDAFLDTANGPVSDKNMQITFGASVTNNTPAGLYSTDLSLIATGKF